MLRVPFYILALSRLVLVVGIFGAVGYYFVSNGVGQGVSFLGIAPTCEGGGTSCAIVRCDVANGNCEKNNVAGVEIIPDRDGLGNALQAKDSSRLFVRGGRGSPEEIIVETQTERSRIQATGGQVVPLFSERLVYDGVTQKPIVSQGSVIAPDARQKDAYVFLPSESTAARLKVITASRVPNQPAGNSIIVADSIAQLSVDASGFTGRDGESVRDVLAKGVISNPNLYPSGSFGAYLARTQGRPFESVSFLDSDMSNHAQYGLQCRSDEVPVEYEIPSRSVVRAPSTAPNSSGMNITAFGQERAARAFCARKPEYTSFQSCEAEAEYTFEAECRVKPETRQARFYQHPVVYWQRAICANTADEQFRRDIVRTARVQLNVPGKKQFDGTVSRRIAFSDSYFVVDRIAGPGSESNRFDLNNGFYSPFWKQNPTYEQGVTLEVERLPAAGATPAAGIRVDNTIPISPPVTNAPTLAKPQIVYDGQVPVAHSIDYYKAPRVTYVPREATSASSATAAQWSSYRGASLFDFMNVSGDASAANTWYANSCADVRAVSLTAEGNNFNPYALMTQINSISPSPSTSDLSGLFGRLSRSYNFMDLTETGLSEDDIFQSQPVADSLSTSYARLNNVQYLWVADASGNPIAPLLAPKDYLASPHTLLAGRHIPAPLVGTPANGYSICSSSEFGSTSSSRFLCVGAFPALALDGSLVTTTVTTGTFKPFPNVQVGTNDPQPGLVCIQSPTLTCSGDPVTTPIAADFISASLVSVETSITSMSIEGGKLTANQTDLRFSLSSTGLLDGFTYPNGTKVVALSSAQYFRITNNANLWTRVNVTQSGVVAGLIASSTQPGPFSVEKLPGSKFLVDRNGMRVLKPGVQLRVSNCLAYEVIDGIDQGSSYKAKWVNISKAGYELACNQLGRQKLVPEEPEPAPLSGFSNIIGRETFLQFEKDSECYHANPGDSTLDNKGLADLKRTDRNMTYKDPDTTLTIPIAKFEQYCVDVEERSSSSPMAVFSVDALGIKKLLKAKSLTTFNRTETGGVQVGDPQWTCVKGIRLDRFRSNSPMQCQSSASEQITIPPLNAAVGKWQSGQKVSSWTSNYNAPTWYDWDHQSNLIDQDFIPQTENGLYFTNQQSYKARSTLTESRYDNLPVLTTVQTHEVDDVNALPPGLSATDPSSTGKKFPPVYFTTADGVRSGPGYLRETDLRGVSGEVVSPDSFIPYRGPSLQERGNRWCNAKAWETDSATGLESKGFGAKGKTRDLPKRVFQFSMSYGSGSATDYFGIEIVKNTVPTPYNGFNYVGDATSPLNYFRTASYPTLGARSDETPSASEWFNDVGGFVYRKPYEGASPQVSAAEVAMYKRLGFAAVEMPPRGPAVPSTRMVSFTENNNKQVPYLFKLSAGPIGIIPYDIYGAGINAQMLLGGFLRPLFKMPAQSSFVDSWLQNPGSFSQKLDIPGFRKTGESESNLAQETIILALPFRRNATSGAELPMSIRSPSNGSMPEFFDSSLYGSPIVLKMVFQAGVTKVYMLRRGALVGNSLGNGGLENRCLAASEAFPRSTVDNSIVPSACDWEAFDGAQSVLFERFGDSNENLRMKLQVGAQAVFTLANFTESIVSGVSATTGQETLEFIASRPYVRNRALEGRFAAEGGLFVGGRQVYWPGTAPSDLSGNLGNPKPARLFSSESTPSNDISSASLTCAVRKTEAPNDFELKGVYKGSFSPKQGSLPLVINGINAPENPSGYQGVLTAEELSLFTKTVANSNQVRLFRPALTQWSPWSFEIRSGNPATNADGRGSWIGLGQMNAGPNNTQPKSDPATSPAALCQIFNSNKTNETYSPGISPYNAVLHEVTRAEMDRVRSCINNYDTCDRAAVLTETGVAVSCTATTCLVSDPTTRGETFLSVARDPVKRRSNACLKWDAVDGSRCLEYGPSMPLLDVVLASPDELNQTAAGVESLHFGGSWEASYVQTRDRLSQDCTEFSATDSSKCLSRVQGRDLVSSLCTSKPGSCPFITNSQMVSVVPNSRTVDGLPGEDGTQNGRTTVFCRQCPDTINFVSKPGLGGMGSGPVSSSQSSVLSCMSWNKNPVAPQVNIRNLTSQPFLPGARGSNGRNAPANPDGTMDVYSDLSPAAIWELSNPDFYGKSPGR